MTTAFVVKRNGKEEYSEEKVASFLSKMSNLPPQKLHIDVDDILPLQGVPSEVTSSELRKLVAETAAYHTVTHPDYAMLAGRILISGLKKTVPATFTSAMSALGPNVLNSDFLLFVSRNAKKLQAMIVEERDYTHDVFAVSTLMRSYLMRDIDREIVELPQYMWLRVSVALHMDSSLEKIKETYDLLSTKQFTHATPTLFNSGAINQQMASCFLLDVPDSIDGIFSTLRQCALISKNSGGLGISISKVRGTGSIIRGNMRSSGIVPMLRNFESMVEYCDQGGKRKGSCATFLRPYHVDIEDWLELKKPDGVESRRCRSLFYGLWVSDLFMRRVKSNGDWSLFDNTKVPLLESTYGEEFERIYIEAEKAGKAVKTIKAQYLWNKVLESQIETGTPYVLFADACNKRNNQKAAGALTGSNLCTEILEYKDTKEVAVCTLASISLPACVKTVDGQVSFDFKHLRKLVDVCVRNLNITIDKSTYPVPEAEYGHKKRRPIGLGVQGLSDCFQLLSLVFGSEEALNLDRKIFETMYLQAVTTSCHLAKKHGPYKTFKGSPLSQGLFQFDMYDEEPNLYYPEEWAALRKCVMRIGVRNSLLIALMPTASSAQILGNSESFEVRTSNCYVRRVLGGEFVVTNPILYKNRKFTPEMVDNLITNRGSVQNMQELTEHERKVFRHAFETGMKDHIKHCAARQRFVCQSQSMNLYFATPTKNKIHSALFYAWESGCKTGSYYLRRLIKGRMMGIKQVAQKNKAKKPEMKSEEEDEVCVMCSS